MATPTTSKMESKPASAIPRPHMASLKSHEGADVDANARLSRSDSEEVLSLDGIGGMGLASRLATTPHYKNFALCFGCFFLDK